MLDVEITMMLAMYSNVLCLSVLANGSSKSCRKSIIVNKVNFIKTIIRLNGDTVILH